MAEPTVTERQRRYAATMHANLERNTGRSLAAWVEIARSCPETRQRAQLKWLKDNHGLLQNHGLQVLAALAGPRGEDETQLRAALWSHPAAAAILAAVELLVAAAPGLVAGQRKGYTCWSREFQFAAAKPIRGGALLGLAVDPDASPRLERAKNDGWSERLKSHLRLASPTDADNELAALMKASWERS